MYVERGVLVAESASEYPEAVERTLSDASVAMIHMPDMITAAGIQDMDKLYPVSPSNPNQKEVFDAYETLMREVPGIAAINEVIVDWAANNGQLGRYPIITGPELSDTRNGLKMPHLDSNGNNWKRGPLTLSVCTAGERIFSAERLPNGLLNGLGRVSLLRTTIINSIVRAHVAAWKEAKDFSFELPARAVQKAGDGIWLPAFPNPSIHSVKIENYWNKIKDDDPSVTVDHAALFDYRMWRNARQVNVGQITPILDRRTLVA